MEKYLEILKKVRLFDGIKEDDLKGMLSCLGAVIKDYDKDDIIFLAGSTIESVGIVINGSIKIVKEDINGNRNILGLFKKTDIFGEVFACARIHKIPVTVLADESSTVMFIDFERIISQCQASCVFHSRLVENMLKIMALKNLSLKNKLDCIGRRTTRERVEVFLMSQMQRAGQNPFVIEFSRAEMADYLCVERSALSAVLSKMRDEGEIEFEKNKFKILSVFED